MTKVNFIWRLICTGCLFALFGVGGVFLTFLVFPFQKVIYRDETLRKQKARKTVHHVFKFYIGLMKSSGVADFQIDETLKFDDLKGHLILANHPSLIDVVVLISLIPNADCIVKAHLFKNPFIRGVIQNLGYISNDNPDELIKDCQRSLAQGNNLIVFPEGTRTVPGEEIKFQRGAANVALRCKAQLVTTLLRVTPTTLTKSEKWYQIPTSKVNFMLSFASNVPQVAPYEDIAPSKASRDFTRQLEQHFIEELKVYE